MDGIIFLSKEKMVLFQSMTCDTNTWRILKMSRNIDEMTKEATGEIISKSEGKIDSSGKKHDHKIHLRRKDTGFLVVHAWRIEKFRMAA